MMRRSARSNALCLISEQLHENKPKTNLLFTTSCKKTARTSATCSHFAKFTELRKVQTAVTLDLKHMNDHVNQDLRKATRVFGDQLHDLATKRTEEISRLNDMVWSMEFFVETCYHTFRR